MKAQKEKEETGIVSGGRVLVLFLAGFLFVVVGAIILTVAALLSSGSQGSFGVVIFIGPFPIVIGGGPDAQWLIPVAIILAVMSLVLFLFLRREKRRLETRV